jgi:hypothetical protein
VVTRLEAALVDCGWAPAPPGHAWYARRFTWGTIAPASRTPVAASPRTERPAKPASRPPASAWPEGTADLARCEIKWMSSYRSSRFEAVAYQPGEKRGATIGASDAFKWMFNAEPDWRDAKQLDAVKALRSALIAGGWEEVGEGPVWYGRRFVWRGEGEPPTALGSGG